MRVAVDGPQGIVEVAAGTAVFGALGIVLYHLMVRRAFIRLSSTSLSIRHWYGRTRTIPRHAVARMVFVRVRLGSMRSNRLNLLLFLDGDGRRLLGTDLAGFRVEDWAVLVGMLAQPVDVADPLGPAGPPGRYPGWVAWYWKHPAAIGIALALILFAIVVVGVLVATGTNPFTD